LYDSKLLLYTLAEASTFRKLRYLISEELEIHAENIVLFKLHSDAEMTLLDDDAFPTSSVSNGTKIHIYAEEKKTSKVFSFI